MPLIIEFPVSNARPRSPYGFCLAAALMLWATVPESMAAQIFIRQPDGRQIGPFTVEMSDSIDYVKQFVQDRLGTPPERQYLYYGNQLLLDGRTLSDYNVPDGSTLPLVATWSFGLPPLPQLTAWAFGISDVNAGMGTGWTNWSSSTVDFTGYSVGSFVLDIHSYAGSVAGTPAGYDPQAAYDWTFLNVSVGITGFSADLFSVTGDFASRASLYQAGNDLVLHLAPVPEPAAYATVLAGACGAYSLWRRRKRS